MSKSSGVRLTAAERKEKALAYRKQGYSFAAIGQLCGCSDVMAHKIVNQYLRELATRNTASAEELRQLELSKLDQIELTLHQQLQGHANGLLDIKHTHKALELLLKVQQQRAKLLGLVLPTQVLVPVPVSGPEKGRVETVVSDPRLADVVDEAKSWAPPAPLVIAPAEVRAAGGA